MTSRAVIEEFWQRFLFVRGLPQSAQWQDCFHFETTPAGAEHALGLVLQGIKRATFTSLNAFQQRGLRPPSGGICPSSPSGTACPAASSRPWGCSSSPTAR